MALPVAEGRAAWKTLHETVNNLSCLECREFGKKFITYMHDLVNIKLGKPIFDQDNFDEMQHTVGNISNKSEDELREMFSHKKIGCKKCKINDDESLINTEKQNDSMAKLTKIGLPIGSIFLGRAVQELEKNVPLLSQPIPGLPATFPLKTKALINIGGGLLAVLYGAGIIGRARGDMGTVALFAGGKLLVDEVTDIALGGVGASAVPGIITAPPQTIPQYLAPQGRLGGIESSLVRID